MWKHDGHLMNHTAFTCCIFILFCFSTDRLNSLGFADFRVLLNNLFPGLFWRNWSKLKTTSQRVSDQLQIARSSVLCLKHCNCTTRPAWQCDVNYMRWWYSLNALSGTFLDWHSFQEERVWSKLKGTVSIGSTANPASSWSSQSSMSPLSQE